MLNTLPKGALGQSESRGSYTADPNVAPAPTGDLRPQALKQNGPTAPRDFSYMVAEVGDGTTQFGELTGNALYNATFAALQDLCPGTDGGCDKTRKFVIPGIKFTTPASQVLNTGLVDIAVDAQLDSLPKSYLKTDFIHIIASVLAKQSENKTHCERTDTPCHSHECLPSSAISTFLCTTSDSVSVRLENTPTSIYMVASLVFRESNATRVFSRLVV